MSTEKLPVMYMRETITKKLKEDLVEDLNKIYLYIEFKKQQQPNKLAKPTKLSP